VKQTASLVVYLVGCEIERLNGILSGSIEGSRVVSEVGFREGCKAGIITVVIKISKIKNKILKIQIKNKKYI